MRTYEEILEAMEERYKELAGFPADSASDIGIRLRVLALEIHTLCGELEELGRQVFPQTSSGEALELHARTRNITRKPARTAEGMLRFSRETAALSDIPIGAGVLCATREEEPVLFETAEDGVLPAGELSVELPARAAEAGAAGNVGPGAVCLMVSSAAGISAVGNPAAFSGGTDAESDTELKKRLLLAYENVSNTTNSAFYYDLAMSNEGVASARVLPRARGRGTVDVVIAGYSQGEEGGIVEELQALLEEQKEINVSVLVRAAERDRVDVSLEIALEEEYDFATVSENCRRAVAEHLDRCGVGDKLLLAELGSLVYGLDGVYNCRVLLPARDHGTASGHVVRAGEVAVARMEGA